MASGTINIPASASSGAYIDSKIVWSSTTNESANTSNVTAKLYVRKDNTDMPLTVPTKGKWPYTLTVNGSKISGSADASVLTSWVLIATKTVNSIAHNTNGAKSITISCSVSGPSTSSYSGHTTSGSGTATLDTIARPAIVTRLAASSKYLDSTISVDYTAMSSSYYYKQVIYLKQGSTLTTLRTTKLGKKSMGQQTNTITLSSSELSTIYSNVTTTTTATIRVAIATYSDSGYNSKIGSSSYLDIDLTIPTSTAPTVSLSASPDNSNAWINDKNIYVAGYSKVKLSLSATAKSGATIKSTNISGSGFSSTSNPATTSIINNSGNITFTGKATDSRGQTGSTTKTVTFQPYTIPVVTSVRAQRGTWAPMGERLWTAEEDGGDIKVTFNITLSLGSYGNTYTSTFKLDDTVVSPDASDTLTGESESVYNVYFLQVEKETTHTLSLTVKDSVGNNSLPATISIPTTNITMEFKANGKGIAFGKTSEEDAFECQFPAMFYNAFGLTGTYSTGPKAICTQWADGANHDLIVRGIDGITTAIGWTGSGSDGNSYDTVLDIMPKTVKVRGKLDIDVADRYTTDDQEVFIIGNLQIITGRISSIAANSSASVIFKSPFKYTPRMVVTGDDSNTSQFGGVGNVYAGSAYIYNRGSSACPFIYIAIGITGS